MIGLNRGDRLTFAREEIETRKAAGETSKNAGAFERSKTGEPLGQRNRSRLARFGIESPKKLAVNVRPLDLAVAWRPDNPLAQNVAPADDDLNIRSHERYPRSRPQHSRLIEQDAERTLFPGVSSRPPPALERLLATFRRMACYKQPHPRGDCARSVKFGPKWRRTRDASSRAICNNDLWRLNNSARANRRL